MSYADGSPVYLPQNLAPNEASPGWNNKADNAWQLTAATLVGMQSVPGLVILYGSMVKKKWAVNSAFMALYAFAAVLVCWVLWAHSMAFGDPLCPLMGKPHPMLSQHYLLNHLNFGSMPKSMPTADYVYFQFAFAAITVILLAGSLLGRMNFYAWMMFVPLWLTFSYTVGAFCIWGDGFLNQQDGIRTIDYAGGFVIHLSSGVAGFTAAYWVGPRLSHDRQNFPPNNIIHMLGGAGFLWLGWTGFNGGSPFVVSRIASLAILNTHLCTSTSLIVWVSLDMIFYRKSSVIGAVQGMITGLVCITPGAARSFLDSPPSTVFQALYTLSGVDIIHRANYLVANLIIHFARTSNIATAGVVDPWAAALMGAMSGSVPWYTMMVLHRRSAFFQKVDDTLAVFHTHAVAGVLGGILSGLFAKPNLLRMFYFRDNYTGLLYGIINGKASQGLQQMLYQLAGVAFITVWNVVATSFICLLINRIVNLRMVEDELEVGDGAAHGEEAYALWGDGEKMPNPPRFRIPPRIPSICRRLP